MVPDVYDLILIFGYIFYETGYYLIYGDKVHYPVYRVDGKHIILGTCHTNHIDSIDKNILNELELCSIVCVEAINTIPEKTIKVVLDNLDSSNEDKIVNVINSFEGKIKNKNEINNYYYKKEFLNRIRHRFVDEEIDIKYVLNLHLSIIIYLYDIHSILQMKALVNDKKLIDLDEQEESKKIRENFEKPIQIATNISFNF